MANETRPAETVLAACGDDMEAAMHAFLETVALPWKLNEAEVVQLAIDVLERRRA